MTKCQICKSKMPTELFQPLFMNGEYITGLCPICVMAVRNKAIGFPLDTPPQGEIASDLVEEAWQYYKPKGKEIYKNI